VKISAKTHEYRLISVKQLTPNIGAELSGVDLSKPLTEDLFREVHRALLDNLVIFFRDQTIDEKQHIAFARKFGELYTHPKTMLHLDGFPEISVNRVDENSKRGIGEDWHSDGSCEPEPPMGTILYLLEAPPSGGDTMFANMYMAYETLSQRMKDMLTGLTAIHDRTELDKKGSGYNEQYRASLKTEHPVVCTHPVTGRRYLFVNRTMTTRILQLEPAESDSVLQMLFRHIEKPIIQCRFRWQRRSIAFWDNICTQHKAIWDYFPNRRIGHRISIKGVRPALLEQGQKSLSAAVP
jgi:taurine dioxygenase